MKDDALKSHVMDVLRKAIPDIEPWDYGTFKIQSHESVYRLNIRKGEHVVKTTYGFDKTPILIVLVSTVPGYPGHREEDTWSALADPAKPFFRFQTPLAQMKGVRKMALCLRKKLDRAPLFELVQA